MSGDWLALGAVAALAAAGAVRRRGSAARIIHRQVVALSIDGLVEYLASPSLEGWQDIRNRMVRPFVFGLGTIWQAVGKLAWWEKTGERGRPPFAWGIRDPEAFPDDLGKYPSAARVERAILFVLDKPMLIEAGSEQALEPEVDPQVPGPQRWSHSQRPIHLFYGENPDQHFWESEISEVGIGALLLQRRKEGRGGFWSVQVIQSGEHRLLTRRVSGRTTTTVTTGGTTAADAVAAAQQHHGLWLMFDRSRVWKDGALVPA